MATETIEQKARRILTEGRLVVTRVDERMIVAECRGFSDGEVYALGYDGGKQEWRCTCEANSKFRRRCSHLIALQLVTTRPKGGSQ